MVTDNGFSNVTEGVGVMVDGVPMNHLIRAKYIMA